MPELEEAYLISQRDIAPASRKGKKISRMNSNPCGEEDLQLVATKCKHASGSKMGPPSQHRESRTWKRQSNRSTKRKSVTETNNHKSDDIGMHRLQAKNQRRAENRETGVYIT